MGQLCGTGSFFHPGPPAAVGKADAEIMDFLIARVEGETLDLGGGRGAYAHALREQGHQVTLAEKNLGCLEDVQKLGIPVVDMNTASWSDLKGRFDTIILIEVLEHVENPMEFLGNVIACARRKVLLTVPCNDDFEKLFKCGLTYNHIAVTDHLHQFKSEEISLLFRALKSRMHLHRGAYLFPRNFISIMNESLAGNKVARLALFPLRLFNKIGWLPRLFPSRIFVEAYPPVSSG